MGHPSPHRSLCSEPVKINDASEAVITFKRLHQLVTWKNTVIVRGIRSPTTGTVFKRLNTRGSERSETKLPESSCQGKSYWRRLRVFLKIKKQTPASSCLFCLRKPKGIVSENTNLLLWNSKAHTILAALRVLLRIWTESQTKRIGREMLDLPAAVAGGLSTGC